MGILARALIREMPEYVLLLAPARHPHGQDGAAELHTLIGRYPGADGM